MLKEEHQEFTFTLGTRQHVDGLAPVADSLYDCAIGDQLWQDTVQSAASTSVFTISSAESRTTLFILR